MDAIRDDPDWQGGEYKTQPMRALVSAENLLLIAGSAPLFWQKQAPTRDAADKFYADRLKAAVARLDANDLLYQIDSSREYNPEPKLETIKAPLIAVNSADYFINPPELGMIEKEIKRVKGVGNYAAENLMKLLGRYDGLALDSWTRAQFAKSRNNGRPASDKKIARFYSRFNSWRGLVLWCDMTRHWLEPERILNW